MTDAHLSTCPGCCRHIRVTEVDCPFCGGALDDSFHGRSAPVPLTVRLTRAARYALGTGTLSLAAACSASGLFPLGAGVDAGEAGTSGGGDSGYDASASPDTSMIMSAPPYGAFPFDASSDDAGVPSDAAVEDVFVGVPYGLPP
jgi:hypothetical protein